MVRLLPHHRSRHTVEMDTGKDWSEMSNLIKQIRFDNDVLGYLRSMVFSNDGLSGKLTCGQLDRKMYEKVNKALDAMGGKWNKKSGCHLFQTDPRPSVEGLLENGVLEVERDGFFETPRAVIERMLELVPVSEDDYILEPSAGLGAIADALREHGARQILVFEKNQERRNVLVGKKYFTAMTDDFLERRSEPEHDKIYMNPPFENQQDIDHVKHAYEFLKPGGRMVSVMSSGAFFREDKKATEFRNWLCGKGGYSEPLPEGSFKESGTGVNAVLVVISKAEK